MGKIGAFSYPEIPLDEAIAIATLIATRFKGRIGRGGLAQALGQQESSGWFSHKLAALRDFGLIEGRGAVRLTALAQRVAFPASDKEAQKTKHQALDHVALFHELAARFQGEEPDLPTLVTTLEELTGATRTQVIRKASLIQRHLAQRVEIKRQMAQAQASAGPRKNSQEQADAIGHSVAQRTLEIIVGQVRLTAPITDDGLDIAIILLQGLRHRWG